MEPFTHAACSLFPLRLGLSHEPRRTLLQLCEIVILFRGGGLDRLLRQHESGGMPGSTSDCCMLKVACKPLCFEDHMP